MSATYSVKLYDIVIGHTQLEKADPPLGMVAGKMELQNIDSGYDFFSVYCKETEAQINVDYPDFKFIDAESIRGLGVFDAHDVQVNGATTTIRGFDSDSFEIEVAGIPKTEYASLFPEHTAAYENQFKSQLRSE
ncbi:hypothetical protein [Tolumonas lignilytica]|uniref:hypothetical protein n=1 Tax=Tolumonas lignilytica TaxID=1283284 RepID=UPI0004670962|nr:hypothetical protein [Tolumonas lignilytica]